MTNERAIEVLKAWNLNQSDEFTPHEFETAFNMAIKALSADGDLISRTELLNAIWQKEYGKDYDGVNSLNVKYVDIIDELPTIPQTDTAEWIPRIFMGEKAYECSKCGKLTIDNYSYCPNCGSRMKGEYQ